MPGSSPWSHTLPSGHPVEITTVAARPDLAGANLNTGPWPNFMHHNRVSEAYFHQTLEAFPTTCLVATTADGVVIGDAHAVQLRYAGQGRPEFPAAGWEQAVVWAFADAHRGLRPPTSRHQCDRPRSTSSLVRR